MEYVVIALALLVLLIVGAAAYVVPKRRRQLPPSATGATGTDLLERPPVREEPPLVEEPAVEEPVVVEPEPVLEKPEPTAGRLVRLRARLARSQNVFGRGLLALLSRDKLDDDTWDEVEESLIMADVGVDATRELVERLRERARVLGTGSADGLRKLLTEELTTALDPQLDRALRASADGRPAVLLVVGVNGSGKTTTCGKIARVLVADGRS